METTESRQTAFMDVNVFLALWIGTYVLVYLLLYIGDKTYWSIINLVPNDLAIQMANLQYTWILVGFLLMALLYGIILASMQAFLIQRILGFQFSQWFIRSLVGWLVGGFFAYYAESVRDPAFLVDGFVLSLIAFWMPAALIQATVLRSKTRLSWVWVVSNLVALLLFALTYGMIGGIDKLVLFRPIGFIPAAIVQGAVTAGAVFQMFPQPAEQ